jgi:hypothetical protein
MNWAIDINTLIQIATLVFIGGMGWMRIKILERDLQELKKEVVDFRELKSDLAVIKTQLEAINKNLQKDQ